MLRQSNNQLAIILTPSIACVCDIKCVVTNDGWRRAKLPVKHGGLSVLCASDIALLTYLASIFESAELSLQLLSSSLMQLGGTSNVKYTHYVGIW
jgi:hypothetical protein